MLNGVPFFDYDPPGFDAGAVLGGDLVGDAPLFEKYDGPAGVSPAPFTAADAELDAALFGGPNRRVAPALTLEDFPDLAAALAPPNSAGVPDARADDAEADSRSAAQSSASDTQTRATSDPQQTSGTASDADSGSTVQPVSRHEETTFADEGGLITPQSHDQPPGGCQFLTNDYLLVGADAVSGVGDTLYLTADLSAAVPKDTDVTFTISGPNGFSEQYSTTVPYYGVGSVGLETDPITQAGMLKVSAIATRPASEGGGTLGPARDGNGDPIPDVAGDPWCITPAPSFHTDDDGLYSNEEYAAMVGVENVRWEAVESPLSGNNHPTDGGGYRIFPGKADPDDTAAEAEKRREVYAIADMPFTPTDTPDLVYDDVADEWVEDNDPWTLEGQEMEVHFRAFDVDDPSAETGPVDEKDENTIDGGPTGDDNRGHNEGFTDRTVKPMRTATGTTAPPGRRSRCRCSRATTSESPRWATTDMAWRNLACVATM